MSTSDFIYETAIFTLRFTAIIALFIIGARWLTLRFQLRRPVFAFSVSKQDAPILLALSQKVLLTIAMFFLIDAASGFLNFPLIQHELPLWAVLTAFFVPAVVLVASFLLWRTHKVSHEGLRVVARIEEKNGYYDALYSVGTGLYRLSLSHLSPQLKKQIVQDGRCIIRVHLNDPLFVLVQEYVPRHKRPAHSHSERIAG